MKLNEIRTNPDNPRIIKDGKFKKLVQSLKDFPKMLELRPIVVDKDGMILGGNMRYRALQELKMTEIPDNWVKKASDLTEDEKKRFIVEDNLPFGEWDWDLLANNFDVEDLLDWGFDEKDLKIDQEVDEDEAPEVEEGPSVSKLGEVYQLGKHRLMCGDSTKIEDVEKLMDGKKANVLITDPPYGVDYASKNEFLNKMDKGNRVQKDIENDAIKDYKKFYTDFLINLKDKFDNTFYIFISGKEIASLIVSINDCNYHYAQEIIWVKNNHVLGRMDYSPKHENIVYGWQNKHKFFGGFQTSIIEYDKPMVSSLHPTMKPIGLITRLIKDSTLENNIILDVFGGSGSTLIACEQTDRTCYMMELDPKYCDVIRKRYANLIEKGDEWEKITPSLK